MKRLKHFNIHTVIVILAGALLVASATDAMAKKGLGSLLRAGGMAATGVKTYGDDTLTVSQLKRCVVMEQSIDANTTRLQSDGDKLETRENALDKLQTEIDSLEQYLQAHANDEFTSQQAVDSYNGKVERFKQTVADYNQGLESYRSMQASFNSRVDAYNEEIDIFKTGCAGKQYYEDDMRDVLAQLGQ